jgi:RimJ/RimL family protein N-acetyltransferase
MELKPLAPEHFATLISWFPTESALVQWGGPKLIHPLDDFQLNEMLNDSIRNPPTRQCWMSYDNNVLIGHAQLTYDWKNGNVTLGRVAVAPQCRGQRLAVPMLKLVLGEAFRYPEIMRVELNVFSFNSPAIQTYVRLGFLVEGTRRSSVLVGKERWDTIIMAILRSEYEPV